MNTDSPRVVLRSGSLYFGAWPPSLRERPWRGVHLHGRVRSRGSNGLFSHVECGTHGTHGCSQIFVAAFAERFRKRATGSYPVFSVKQKRKGKSGWYQSSTVWLCQAGARAPLTRRPFRSPSGPNFVKTWARPERTAPLTRELGVAMGSSSVRGRRSSSSRLHPPSPRQAVCTGIAGDAVPDPLGHVGSAREREVQQHRWALPDVGAS